MTRSARPVHRSGEQRAEQASALAAAGAALVCMAALAGAGRTLPFPRDLSAEGLLAFVERVGLPTAAFTGLRAVALALLGWCLVTGAAGVVARRARSGRAVRLVDRISPRSVRRLAEAVAGLGVVAALVPGPGAGAGPVAASEPRAVVTMADLGATMVDLGPVVLGSRPAEPALLAPTRPEATPPEVAPEPGAAPAPDPARTWRIRPGDTLWHVAELTAGEALGRPATLDEVARHLDALIALNRSRLAVADDPGLVFPGQEFVVP